MFKMLGRRFGELSGTRIGRKSPPLRVARRLTGGLQSHNSASRGGRSSRLAFEEQTARNRILAGPEAPSNRRIAIASADSRLDVGPTQLLQLHDVDDAGLDQLGLRNDRNILVLRLAHVLLRIAAGLVRNLRRAQRYRFDTTFYRRGVVAQHVQ